MNIVPMIVAGLLQTAMGVCVKLAGAHFGTGEIMLSRTLIPTIALIVWMLASKRSLKTKHWRTHLFRSTAGACGLLLYFTSLAHLPLATAVTLTNTSALFMALIISFRRRPPALALLTIAAGFVGVSLVLQPAFASQQWVWGLVGLSSGLTACIVQLNLHELGRLREPVWRTVAYFSIASSMLSIPLVNAHSGPTAATTSAQYLLLISVGVLGGGAQFALSRAFASGHPLMNASLSYLQVVFASLIGIPLWGDRLTPLTWFGIAVIVVAGIFGSQPGLWQRHVEPKPPNSGCAR